ncbi:MAG TPA: hypothetical protein VKR06_17130 [Ktedonosporobacter sp.]|nr:hypothetical protein [Ktedonosporobacter sp.]
MSSDVHTEINTVDLAFVVDTTGSMGGLIEVALLLWSGCFISQFDSTTLRTSDT